MNNPADFGFIIVRHISMEDHTKYWRECVKCIRQFYSTEKIIIIDDNSTLQSDNIEKDMKEFYNIQIVSSEYPGAGEILGYYYGWKYRPFKQFVVMHDSMFLQSKLPRQEQRQKITFLWHFDKYLGQAIGGTNDTNVTFINYCNEREKLFNLYYDKLAWFGCFGVASLITLELLDTIFFKYNLENCMKYIKVRHDREAMERVFALIAMLEEPALKMKPSICGNILTDYPNAYSVKWHHYMQGYRNNNIVINKVWSGR